jgi:hypothetical protein
MNWKFNSLAAFAEACREKKLKTEHDSSYERSWTGETLHECLKKATGGDESLVGKAETMVDSLEANFETPSRRWSPNVAGAYPNVPDVLAGLPENMRYLEESCSSSSPVRVFVCTTSSAGVDAETLRNRGVAILAFVMLLTRTRPVELWTFTALDGKDEEGASNVMVRIKTDPLCLSEACYALTSVGVDRLLTHSWSKRHNGYTGGWARGFAYNGGAEGAASVRHLVTDNPIDLVLGPTWHGDQIVTDPIGWVKDQLAAYQPENADA